MSCDVCPFCGKTYKRLKSHLPHCKAVANDTSQQKKKSSPLVSDKSALQSTKSKKASQLASTPTASFQTEAPPSPSQSSQRSAPAKKKKQKLSDQIKAAAAAAESSSSSSAPLPSIQSPPVSPTRSKPKMKRDHATTEATNVGRATHQAAAAPPTRPGSRGGDSIRLSADLQAPPAAKVKLSVISEPSVSLNCEAGESGDDFCGANRETQDSSVGHLTSKAGGGHRVAKITIQDAKATLGRSSRKAGVLHQLVLPGSKADATTGADLSRVLLQIELDPFPNIPSSLPPPVQVRGSNQQPSSWLLPPQVSQATPYPSARAGSLNEALHTISPILSPFRRHRQAPGGPWMFLEWAEPQPEPGGASRAGNNTGGRGATGCLEPHPLGQVTLKELPDWLSGRTPRQPRDFLVMLQKGWTWYYRRYIDVKKGGVGGLGMLLAGYCVLSYAWSYPHLKQHRWRKYH